MCQNVWTHQSKAHFNFILILACSHSSLCVSWSCDSVTECTAPRCTGTTGRCITGCCQTTRRAPGLAKRVKTIFWFCLKMPNVSAFESLGPLYLFSPFSLSLSRPPRCSPPLSRSSSFLPVSASTRRPTRPPTSLLMPPLSQSKDRQGPISVGRPLTRPPCARTSTVSAYHS